MSSAAAEVKVLYRTFLRYGRTFPSYNIREYISRRAREGFRENKSLGSPSEVAAAVEHAKSELAVVKRQALVYNLYGRKLKHVLDVNPGKA